MKVSLVHPAIVDARLKNGRSVKPSFIWAKSEFDLTVLEPHQAPIAFEIITKSRFRAQNCHLEMRDVSGRLFLQDDLLEKHQTDDDNIPSTMLVQICAEHVKVFNRHKTGSELFIRVHKALEHKLHPVAGEIRPSGIFSALQNNTLPEKADLHHKISDLTDQIEMTDDVVSQINYWRDQFQDDLSKLALIGSRVFKLSGEPIYTVRETPPNVLVGSSRPSLDVGCVYRTPSMYTSILTNTFSALERDRVDACIEAFYDSLKVDDPHVTITEIVVHDARFVAWNSDEQNAIRAARDVWTKLAKGISVLISRSPPIALPRSLFNIFLDVQEQVRSFEDTGTVADNLSETLRTAEKIWSDTYNGLPRSFRKQLIEERAGISGLLDKETLEAVAERFDNRTVLIQGTSELDRSW